MIGTKEIKMIDIRKILEKGQAELDRQHAEGEKAKAGFFRVGSVGAVGTDGEIYGICHRIALARSKGMDKPIEESQKILFMAGEANEDYVFEKRIAAGFDGKVLSHDQLKVLYDLPGTNRQVIGTPDKALADKDGNILMGCENKAVFGATTAVQVYYEGKPKNENLIQAAAYSMMLNVPYVLVYTSFNWVSMNFYDQKKYGAKHIKPFDRMFYLRWVDDVLEYRDEFKEEWGPYRC
jgi:hypothetical protein